MGLCVQTENEAVSQKCFTLLEKNFKIDTGVTVSDNPYLKRGSVYAVTVNDQEQVKRILQAAKLNVQGEGISDSLCLTDHMVIQNNCCKRAFIRGAFLASGSISNPEKSYHLEIVCQTEEKARHIQGAIWAFDIDAKIVRGLYERRRTDRGALGAHGCGRGVDGVGEYPHTQGYA